MKASPQFSFFPPQPIAASSASHAIESGQESLISSFSKPQVTPEAITSIYLPSELWVFIMQKIKASHDLLSLSTTCQQIHAIYQDDTVYPAHKRQFDLLISYLTHPFLRESLYTSLSNKKLGKMALPNPYTDEWKQLRDQPLNAKLIGETRLSTLIKKLSIISWDLLLQPETLDNPVQAKQLMRLLIMLFPHIKYAEEYITKLFNYGLCWEVFHQLAHIHLEQCIQLVATYFLPNDTQACEFVAEQLSFDIDYVSFLLHDLKTGEAPSALFYLSSSFDNTPLEILFKRGCDLEQQNTHGQTLLLQTVYVQDIRLAARLHQQGANCYASDKIGNTPLIAACTHKEPLELIKLLLEQPDIEVNAQNTAGETALHYAIRYDRYSTISALLVHPKININATTNEGLSILDYAIRQNNLYTLKNLSDLGDLSRFGTLFNFSTLHSLKFLLQHAQLKINIHNPPHASTLYFAIEHNIVPLATKLLATTQISEQDRICAFNYAIWQEKDEIVNAFLQQIDQQAPSIFITLALNAAQSLKSNKKITKGRGKIQ